MTKQLTTQNATITTATIQVQAMTIGARQVTLSVFRQLIEEPLIADDGTLNGEPWGTVNYHPGKCGESYAEHWHAVWQRGEELRRSIVVKEPSFEPLTNPMLDRLATMAALAWLDGEATPFGDAGPLRPSDAYADWEETSRGVSYRPLKTRVSWTLDGVSWATKAHRLAGKAAALAELAARDEPWQKPHAEEAAQGARKELAQEVSAYSTSLDALWEAAIDRIGIEASRQQRHRDVRATLAELPQLFIAV